MLKRVRINGYKSLVDVDVELQPLTVLFGPNSAGKSNFLDALQLLSRITTSKSLKAAFDPPYRGRPLESFTFGPNGIEDLLSRESAQFSIEVDVKLSKSVKERVDRQILVMKRPVSASDEPELSVSSNQDLDARPATVREDYLRYRIGIQVIPRSGVIRITDEYLTSLKLNGEEKARKPFLEKMKNRLHLRMEGRSHPTYYETYLDHSVLSTNLYAPQYPHMVAMREELAEWFFFYLEPRERMRAPTAVKETTNIGSMGEELASYLNTLQATNERQFEAVGKALHAIVPSIDGLRVDINRVGEAELKIVEGGKQIPASVMSEGTLRIIGLLALKGAGNLPALIGFEEPENGIHPRRIQLIAQMLSEMAREDDTTLVITTHSPVFLDVLPSESLYAVNKLKSETTIRPLHESLGALGRAADVSKILNREEESTVSQRVQRGDFDAA